MSAVAWLTSTKRPSQSFTKIKLGFASMICRSSRSWRRNASRWRALERLEHRGAETHDAILQDVVGSAALQIGDCGFLVERPRDEDEWHLGQRALRQLQRLPAAEPRNVVIG